MAGAVTGRCDSFKIEDNNYVYQHNRKYCNKTYWKHEKRVQSQTAHYAISDNSITVTQSYYQETKCHNETKTRLQRRYRISISSTVSIDLWDVYQCTCDNMPRITGWEAFTMRYKAQLPVRIPVFGKLIPLLKERRD